MSKSKNFYEELKVYFNSSSPEQIKKDWEATKEWDNVGPTVDEFCAMQSSRITFSSLINYHEFFIKSVNKIIGTDDEIYPVEICLEDKWFFDKENERLVVLFDNEEFIDFDETYNYSWTVSSEGAKGEKFYIGKIEHFKLFMAYPEDEMWDDTRIFILHKNNEIKNGN